MNKFCTKCTIEQPIENFHKKKNSKDGHSNTCKSCRVVIHKDHYERNKDKYKLKARSNQKQSRQFIENYKKDKSCVCCGDTRPYCLEFHHIDSDVKDSNIADMGSSGASVKKILEEISKCIVVCRNCHAEIYYKIKLRV